MYIMYKSMSSKMKL